MGVPCVQVLAHHDAVNAYVPHLSRAVTTRFQLVINLLSLIGSLDTRTSLVNEFPIFRIPRCFRKQSGVVFTAGMVRSSEFSSGTWLLAGVRCPLLHHRTSPLMPFLGMVETVMLHLLSGGTNRDAIGRNLNITVGFQVLLAAYIKVNKGFNILVNQEVIDRSGIMGGIKQNLIHHAQGETLRKLN